MNLTCKNNIYNMDYEKMKFNYIKKLITIGTAAAIFLSGCNTGSTGSANTKNTNVANAKIASMNDFTDTMTSQTKQSASNSILADITSYSGTSPLALRANEHHIEKPSDEEKKEEYDKIKDKIVVDNDVNTPAKQDQKDIIHQLLEKVPTELTQQFNKLDGQIKLIRGNWLNSLHNGGVKISSETKVISKFGKPVHISDAIVYFDQDSQAPTIYVNSNINYENNADNRRELEYALIRGLVKSNNVIFDEDFVNAVKSYTQVEGIEFYNYPELERISKFGAEDLKLIENQDKMATLFASIMANALENKENAKIWPEMADYLDKFENDRLELVDDVNSGDNNIQEYELAAGHGSRDLDWGNNKGDCLARVNCSLLQEFRNPKSTNVVGYEWELRGGVTKLDPKVVSMDQVLATSRGIMDQSGSLPYIKLVVEENSKDEAFIEVVTGPLTKEQLDTKDFKIALNCIYKVLSGGGTKTLEEFIGAYNSSLSGEKGSELYLLTANRKLKDIQVEMKKPTNTFFQQSNLLLDISKIFVNDNETLKYFKKNVFSNSDGGVRDDYKLFEKAIKSDMFSSNLVSLNNSERITLANGVAATLHKQMLFNFLVMLRSNLNNELKNTDKNEEVSFFVRSAPEDLIYSVLSKEEIAALQVFYTKITVKKNAVGTDSDGEQLYFKIFTQLAKNAGLMLPNYTFEQNPVSLSQISTLKKNTIYQDEKGQYWQSTKSSPKELMLKKQLPENIRFLTEEEVNGYFSGIDSSFNDTFNDYYKALFDGPITNRAKKEPMKIYNYTKKGDGGNEKGYLFKKISDDEISKTELIPYIMPRKWGHEPLLSTSEGKQMNAIVEFRVGGIGVPNKSVWSFSGNTLDFSHIGKFYNEYNDLFSSFTVQNLAVKDYDD
jgi:hypothetical protein